MAVTTTERAPARSGLPPGRATWHWWGVAAGVLGASAHMLTDPHSVLSDAERTTGAKVIELVDRGGYHVGALLGMLAVGCILVLAAGYRRWSDGLATDTLAARVAPTALIASAGAMIVGYGFKGMMAIYLPGGLNEESYPAEGLYSLFMINDLAAYFAWWGVAIAAAAVAWLGLREKVLPRWVGIVSALAFLAPLAFLALTGLTGFPGVITPLWLVIVSIGLALRRAPAA